MRAFHCLALILLVLVLPGAAAADQNQSLIDEVRTIGDALAKAMVDDDVETMMGMYVEDAISLPNYSPRMDGIEAFRKSHDEMAASGMKVTSFISDPTDVWTAGDQVIEIGTYKITLEMAGMPQPIEDHGKYLTIWVRDAEGALKVKVETWNTDVDPMAMMGGEHGHESHEDHEGHEGHE